MNEGVEAVIGHMNRLMWVGVGIGVATMLGWAVFRPYLVAGYRVPPDADERIAALVPLVDMVMAGGGIFGAGGYPGEP